MEGAEYVATKPQAAWLLFGGYAFLGAVMFLKSMVIAHSPATPTTANIILLKTEP